MHGEDPLGEILMLIRDWASWLGDYIVGIIQFLFPKVAISGDVALCLGYLSLLTLLLLAIELSRKAGWIILIGGWTLVLVRIIVLNL